MTEDSLPLTGPPPAVSETPPAPSETPSTEASRGEATSRRCLITLPRFITRPIEALLGATGTLATGASGWVSNRTTRTSNSARRTRPWLEFCDLSAISVTAEGGLKGYFNRLKLNTPYFFFNYLTLGLILTVLSVITRPFTLLCAVLVAWVYFQFFGAEHAHTEFQCVGFSLDSTEKLGCMVFLCAILFWFTAGGLQIFFSVASAVIFVTVIHGALRKPSAEAIPPV